MRIFKYSSIFLQLILIQKIFCCVLIKVNNGIIRGRLINQYNSKKIFYAFQQIPYAAPPIENLRFQEPKPMSQWKGILDATKNTKICYQIGFDMDKETEDCLYLNVYTPKLPSATDNLLLPVMVFFHGGGFIIGDSTYESYGPDFLMSHNVVVVTLNYRLGVFGFLSTQDEVLPGNNGLKDQLFALQWIKNNIHIFGGNNSEVTIFGQSAGAASVGYHLINKKSQDFYRGAIMESSSALNPFAYQRNARYYAFKIANIINPNIAETSSSIDILKVMLEASSKDIDKASQLIATQETYDNVQLMQGYFFAPVIEPESEQAFLTEKMYEVIKNGNASKVPVIIGINSEESISQSTDVEFLKKLMSKYDEDLKALVPKDMNIESDSIRQQAGERIKKMYSDEDLLQNNPAAAVKYMSDTIFTRSVIKFALLQSQFSEVYFYQFSYDGQLGNISVIVEGTDRVGHNEELSYIWKIKNDMFYNYDLSVFPNSDITIHKRLLILWTNFAKTLNPTPQGLDILENITWPVVKSEVEFPYLNIDGKLEIRNFPKQNTFKEWTNIYSEFGVEPYDTY